MSEERGEREREGREGIISTRVLVWRGEGQSALKVANPSIRCGYMNIKRRLVISWVPTFMPSEHWGFYVSLTAKLQIVDLV